MNNPNVVFSGPRFRRLFLNELLDCYRKVLMAAALIFALFLFFYGEHVYGPNGNDPVLNSLYLIPMFIACALFSSAIFNDIHHPLGRYHYLTLPCSNLERYLSKFLLTGPLLLIFATLLYEIFKIVAPAITRMYAGESSPFANVEEFTLPRVLVIYFSIHLWFFTGAIFFKSYSLVRSGLFAIGLYLSFALVGIVALKIVYFDYFNAWFSMQPNRPIGQGAGFFLFAREWLIYFYWTLLYLWLLRVSFTALKDHEA